MCECVCDGASDGDGGGNDSREAIKKILLHRFTTTVIGAP